MSYLSEQYADSSRRKFNATYENNSVAAVSEALSQKRAGVVGILWFTEGKVSRS